MDRKTTRHEKYIRENLAQEQSNGQWEQERGSKWP